MAIKLNYKTVCEYVESVGSKFISSNFNNSKDKYEFLCTQCKKNIFITTFDRFKFSNKTTCGDCSGKRTWDINSVKKYCIDNNSEFISKSYNTVDDKYEFKCSVCGDVFVTTFSKFKNRNKTSCNSCNNMNRYTYEDVKNYIDSTGCTLLSKEYKNFISKLKIKCSCGDIFYLSFNKFKNEKQQCNKCGYDKLSKLKSKEYNEVRNFIHNINGELLSTEYINQSQELKVRCSECKDEFKIIYKFLKKRNHCLCKKCTSSTSNLEIIIDSFLNDNNINYIQQYKFNDCINIRKLPFDFYLPDYRICIEANGIQHYEPREFFGGDREFQSLIKRDNIKINYCKDNNIKLVIIKYDNKDIDNALRKELGF